MGSLERHIMGCNKVMETIYEIENEVVNKLEYQNYLRSNDDERQCSETEYNKLVSTVEKMISSEHFKVDVSNSDKNPLFIPFVSDKGNSGFVINGKLVKNETINKTDRQMIDRGKLDHVNMNIF